MWSSQSFYYVYDFCPLLPKLEYWWISTIERNLSARSTQGLLCHNHTACVITTKQTWVDRAEPFPFQRRVFAKFSSSTSKRTRGSKVPGASSLVCRCLASNRSIAGHTPRNLIKIHPQLLKLSRLHADEHTDITLSDDGDIIRNVTYTHNIVAVFAGNWRQRCFHCHLTFKTDCGDSFFFLSLLSAPATVILWQRHSNQYILLGSTL